MGNTTIDKEEEKVVRKHRKSRLEEEGKSSGRRSQKASTETKTHYAQTEYNTIKICSIIFTR